MQPPYFPLSFIYHTLISSPLSFSGTIGHIVASLPPSTRTTTSPRDHNYSTWPRAHHYMTTCSHHYMNGCSHHMTSWWLHQPHDDILMTSLLDLMVCSIPWFPVWHHSMTLWSHEPNSSVTFWVDSIPDLTRYHHSMTLCGDISPWLCGDTFLLQSEIITLWPPEQHHLMTSKVQYSTIN